MTTGMSRWLVPAVGFPPTHPAGPAQVQPDQAPQRVFVPPSVTPQYLVGFFEGRTGAEGQRSVAGYPGKWMPVKGQVRDVQVVAHAAVVHFYVDTAPASAMPTHVALRFSENCTESIGLLTRGDEITAIGRIDEISRSEPRLRDCEIVER